MTKTIFHKADTRGKENHGWLQSFHTFSFAYYYNPERMHFGALRVLNDDTVEAGMGFDTHSHDNMEIITIPLEGDLEHKDSTGNKTIIKSGDIQVMSAGIGISHSEYNVNKNKKVKFLQIWVSPEKKNVEPRYGQVSLKAADSHNKLQQIISPDPGGEGVWIYQKAWFYLGSFDRGASIPYNIKAKDNGVYAFILNGEITINNLSLNTRDGLGIWDTENIFIKAGSDAKFLLMDVPMKV